MNTQVYCAPKHFLYNKVHVDLSFNHFKGFLFFEVVYNVLSHVKASKSKITDYVYDGFIPLLCFKKIT